MIKVFSRLALNLIRSLPASIDYSAILMLHRVGMRDPRRISSNQNMVIAPGELEAFISGCKKLGWSFISLDDLILALEKRATLNKTLILTFDDGYLDNLNQAAPILIAHEVPFVVYVTSGFIDSGKIPWWYKLEDILASSDALRIPGGQELSVRSLAEKQKAFLLLRQMIMDSGNDAKNCIDWINLCDMGPSLEKDRLFMNWDEVKMLANLPNAMVGAHTHTHAVLSRISDSEVFDELRQSKDLLERHIARPVRHFAYPFGGPGEASQREFRQVSELGFDSAVTTRSGVLNAGSIDRYSLPRCFYRPDFTLKMMQEQLSEDAFKNRIKRALRHA